MKSYDQWREEHALHQNSKWLTPNAKTSIKAMGDVVAAAVAAQQQKNITYARKFWKNK